MQYRVLGSTCLRVSVIGLGTWQLGGEWGRDYTQSEAGAIIGKAEELGINLIDTAECYGDHTSEQLIGDYLARHDRSKWIVATKFGHHFHKFMDRTEDFSAADVRKQLEASLKALRTDYIDLYQFHSGSDAQFQNDELWSTLAELKKAGKVRHLGVSITARGSELQAREAKQRGAEALQIVYNRLERKPEQEVFPHAEHGNLGILARVPLASGVLSGKFKPGATFGKNDARSTFEAEKMQRYINETEKLRSEVPPAIPMARWALAWCLKNPLVATVIPGCKNPQQVEENARAAELAGKI